MKKLFTIMLVAACISSPLMAQVKMGANATIVQPSALLELESTSKGFLPPRMTYLQMVAIPAPPQYLVVACTDCVTPGLYNYVAPSWISVMKNAVSAVGVGYNSLYCGGAATGNYQQNVPTTAANTKSISFNAYKVGSYTIATSSSNGIYFSDTGNITTAGIVTIVLKARGTPVNVSINNYTVFLDSFNTCSFSVTFQPPVLFNCNNVTLNQSPGGPLLHNTAYTGSFVTPYSIGDGTSYPAFSQTLAGLTLTAPAGVYASGGGSVTYTLSGTYNSLSYDTVTFATPGCGNSTFGDAVRNALASTGCGSCVAYEAAYDNDWIQVTAAEYTAVGNPLMVSGAGYKITLPANIGGTVTSNTTAEMAATMPDVLIPVNSYLIGFSTITGSVAGVTSGAGLWISGGSGAINSVYYPAGILPSVYFTGSTRYYFIAKHQGYINSSTGPSYLGVYSGNNGNFCGAVATPTVKSYYTTSYGPYITPTTGQNFRYNHQLITTTQRQW